MGARRARHGAVDGQLDHREGRPAPGGRLRVHQLHPRPGELAAGPEFHGYNTGITGLEEAAKAAGFPFLDMIFFTDDAGGHDPGGGGELGVRPRSRDLPQDQGRGGRLGGRSVGPARMRSTERGARRIRAPRFALALPAWIWFVFFFTLPVLWIVYYSFGYKPDIFHPIATDKLSFDRVPRGVLRARSCTSSPRRCRSRSSARSSAC